MNKEQIAELNLVLEKSLDEVLAKKLEPMIGSIATEKARAVVESMKLDRHMYGKDITGLTEKQKKDDYNFHIVYQSKVRESHFLLGGSYPLLASSPLRWAVVCSEYDNLCFQDRLLCFTSAFELKNLSNGILTFLGFKLCFGESRDFPSPFQKRERTLQVYRPAVFWSQAYAFLLDDCLFRFLRGVRRKPSFQSP